MKEMLPAIIIVNPEMVDSDGNPLDEARILPQAIMVHPDMLDKLLEGLKGAFTLDNFTIMTPKEYGDHAEEIYNDLCRKRGIDPDKTKGSKGIS